MSTQTQLNKTTKTEGIMTKSIADINLDNITEPAARAEAIERLAAAVVNQQQQLIAKRDLIAEIILDRREQMAKLAADIAALESQRGLLFDDLTHADRQLQYLADESDKLAREVRA